MNANSPSPPFSLWTDVTLPVPFSLEDSVQRVGKALFSVLSVVKTHGLHPSATIKISHDADVQALNKQFRGKDMPTNVLSFPTDSKEAVQIEEDTYYLGDIILAFETITAEARAQKKPISHHITHLILHGLLHLMDFNHITEEEACTMETLEIKILALLKIPNPYKDTP